MPENRDLYNLTSNDLVSLRSELNFIFERISERLNKNDVNFDIPTGSALITLASSAPSGWVMMNDGTIGNASSGGTARQNDDTKNLFILLWDNISNTYAPVPGGRGGSANEDFASNKAITLPRQLGRALCISGAGSSLTSRSLGEYLGVETHVLTASQMPAGVPTNAGGSGNVTGASGAAWNAPGNVSSGYGQGSGAAHPNMQPSAFWNVMIKL